MKIESIEDLLTFIETNFNRISDSDYKQLLNETLQVYVYKKPNSVTAAVRNIKAHHEYLNTFAAGHELPLFMPGENL
jgi:hypothetical protein